MRTLDRKLVRDLARMKTQAVAIALVVASGVALFIGTVTAYRALVLSEARYYEQNRFAHVWVRLARAPTTVLRQIAALPGVAAVEGRVVSEAILDLPGIDEPATGLLISIPALDIEQICDACGLEHGRAERASRCAAGRRIRCPEKPA